MNHNKVNTKGDNDAKTPRVVTNWRPIFENRLFVTHSIQHTIKVVFFTNNCKKTWIFMTLWCL